MIIILQGKFFLTEQLEFSKEQEVTFHDLDKIHMRNMMRYNQKIRKQKDVLFNSFNNEKLNIDSLSFVIGNLEYRKELEIFSFLKSVRKICSESQQLKFDVIINKAIAKGGERMPINVEKPLQRKGNRPPPPR